MCSKPGVVRKHCHTISAPLPRPIYRCCARGDTVSTFVNGGAQMSRILPTCLPAVMSQCGWSNIRVARSPTRRTMTPATGIIIPFAYLPTGARGIDQYIGELDMIGVGHGTAFVKVHTQRLFSSGTMVIGTDPHPITHARSALMKKPAL